MCFRSDMKEHIDATKKNNDDASNEEFDKDAEFKDWAYIFEKRRCTSAHNIQPQRLLCTLVTVIDMHEIHSQLVLDRITGVRPAILGVLA